MFDPVDPKQSLPAMEAGILQYWKEEDTFKRSINQRDAKSTLLRPSRGSAGHAFHFYDGPPFATGLPHYGHLLAGIVKDVIPRYQTMKGKRIERRFGWDCHGLPIENLVEKEHDIKDRLEIEKMGVRAFNDLCRGTVQRYTNEWRETVDRMGRWVDMDWDYRTMDPDYMESIWWVFSELWRKKLIYEGHKSMHVCPRCVTPLSNFEVTLGYQDIQDLGTTAMFRLQEPGDTFLLAWTTTSWTLPGNLFLAVGPDIDYVKVREGDAQFIVAEALIENVFKDREYDIVEKVAAKDLVGKKYEPLFPYFEETYREQNAFRIVEGDFVTTDEGTGIVHIATGFGTDDYEVGKRENVEVLSHVGMDGIIRDEVTDFAGLHAKPASNPQETDKKIGAWLKEHGKLFRQDSYQHSYPHCWRCDSPLINYATSSWFVAVENFKEDLLKANVKTDWVPGHIRDGRFGKWLENARDWAISRNRYWGATLPIWRCEETEEIHVIGSRDELMRMQPERFTKLTVLRHAESEGNLIPIYQGELPGTDLTKTGKAQSKEVGKWLKTKEVDVIYSSPLARAQQTAELVAAQTGAEVIVDDRLREVSFGEYEGKYVDFSDLTFVKERRKHKIEKDRPESIYHFDGMESWDSTNSRMNAFLEETMLKHKGQHILVVTHADLVNNVRHYFTNEDPLKLSHQPYPRRAHPYVFFWDHEREAQLDLHKDTVDDITFKGPNGQVFKRIPEVLDCWFESGSMPYAQQHYPFEMEHETSKGPIGFPADFISENLDQTRGWFYTLMVLSTALFSKPAFDNCVCGGMILAEDGKKMSKRLKNYPDPSDVMMKYGADAMRFAIMSSPVVRAEEIRFSEKIVAEALQQVMLPLWNTYSFFVTYANAAEYEPVDSRRHSNHPLDQWIRAEVQDLTNRMTQELDRYDLSATCSELHDTIDALTNWYVRLSRRRFAGKGAQDAPDASGDLEQEDQLNALNTLYDVLLSLSQVLGPFCPFITDAIYLNLVPEDHGSVHLTDWPEVRDLSNDELQLLEKNRLMRLIVSLGMRVRAESTVKTRQPLASAVIALPPKLVANLTFANEDFQLLRQELNVKEISFSENPDELAESIVQVDARKVGPRLGARVQEVIKAAKSGEFTVNNDGTILVLDEKFSPDEAQVVYRGKEDGNIAADKGVVISLDTNLTDALLSEGSARDLIRTVQRLRKESGLAFTDEITLHVRGLDTVLQQHGELIAQETRSTLGESNGESHQVEFEDNKVTIAFEKR